MHPGRPIAAAATDTVEQSPRVLVLSQRNAARRVWYASQYEFEDVIAEVDDVGLFAPGDGDLGSLAPTVRSATNRLRTSVRLPPTSGLARAEVTEDADLFFGVFASAHELRHLRQLRGFRERCALKVAFIVELWENELATYRQHLELLHGFDHVFLFSRGALPGLREITGVPCSYLPTATDTRLFAPPVPAPERSIDVHAYGRRLKGTHQALVAAQEARRLFYLYPTLQPGDFTSHREHRGQLAAVLQRSRYTVVYRNNDGANRARKTGGEDSLTNRYFEAIAAGSVVVGSAAAVPDFGDCFGWPDAVVPIGAPAPDVEEVLARLDADPQRLHRVRTTNVEQSLRRHDWAHRWATVLRAVGLPPRPALEERLGALDRGADAWVAAQASLAVR